MYKFKISFSLKLKKTKKKTFGPYLVYAMGRICITLLI